MCGIKNKKVLISVIIVLAVAAVIFIFIQSRKEFGSEVNNEEAVPSNIIVTSKDKQIILTINPLFQRQSGIVAVPLIKADHQKTFTGYGKVLQVSDISAEQIKYQRAKSDFLTAKNNYEVSFNEYERLQKLNRGNSQNISAKTLQTANAIMKNDKNILQGKRIEYDNMLSYLKQKWGNKFAQDIFNNSTRLRRILEGSDFLIYVSLPSDIRVQSDPSFAMIRVNDYNVKAKFISKPSLTDPQIQGLSYYFIVKTGSKFLLPGMNVSGKLLFGLALVGVIIPSSSIVWNKGGAWAYLEINKNQFYRYEIDTHMPVENGYFIPREKLIGKKIVSSGAQLILSEEFKSQIKTED